MADGARSAERPVEQLVAVSDIAWAKFLGIQWAIGLFGVALLLCMVAVILG